MTTYAIRHPDRGKAHRPTVVQFVYGLVEYGYEPGCGVSGWMSYAERVPLAEVPPEERCKRCWPEGGAE